jgi:1,4-alpha-glucan branching enzyme
MNTDSTHYSGSGLGNMGKVTAEKRGWHDQPFSATVTLPPLAVVWLRPAE